MAISSPGIGSNLDVSALVSGLMAAERRPLLLLNSQKVSFESKISAFAGLKSALVTFQNALQGLSAASRFTAQSATSADSTVFTASASGDATPGSYAIEVGKLAQAHKLASAGFSSTAASVGSGQITLTLGRYDSGSNSFVASSAAKTITIAPGSDSLAAVRDAINAGGLGVTASIVNDGSTNGYRLALSAQNSGAANSIRITVSDDDGNSLDASGLSQLAFDPTAAAGSGKNLSQLQAAGDAQLTIDGISVTSASNVVSGALEGLTLNLFKTSAAPVALDVKRDEAAIEGAVSDFVKAFNEINQKLRDLTKYDSSGKASGVLLGDATARSISTQIRSVLMQEVGGSAGVATLSQIGVAFQSDGTLALDSAKLKTAMANDLDDVARLFAALGRASDAGVSVVGSSSATQPGTYAVNLTQAATRGTLAGSAPPGLAIVAGSNDELQLTINGVAYGITLTAGNYADAASLAAEVQSQLAAAGASASVAVSGGALQVVSADYGSSSTVVLAGGNGAAGLFGGSPTATAGVDVAGTINGIAATGQGQLLSAAASDVSAGLTLRVTGTTTGARGTVEFTRGYADRLDTLVERLLEEDGILSARMDGIQGSIKRITRQQEALQYRLEQIEKRYYAQFAALDALVGTLQSTSNYLTQQLAQIQANSTN